MLLLRRPSSLTAAATAGASRRPRRGMAARAALSTAALTEEAARKFLPDGARLHFSATTGGVNNLVYYVHLDGDDKPSYVIRVYNNGENRPRVIFEHLVLGELNKRPLSFKARAAFQQPPLRCEGGRRVWGAAAAPSRRRPHVHLPAREHASPPLRLRDAPTHPPTNQQVPRTLPARADGGSFAPLSSGAEASLFELIPGSLPKLTHVREMGRAAGELSAALAAVQLAVPSPTAPYYELYKVHHAVSRDKFYAEVAKPSFDACREAIAYLTAQIGAMEASLARFHDLQLPRQLIHVRRAARRGAARR